MKNSLYFLLLFMFSINSTKSFSQQTISYGYDEVGNRVERIIYLERGSTNQSSELIKANKKNSVSKDSKTEETIYDQTFSNQVVKIYPNPTKGMIEIELPEEVDNVSGFQLIVFDMNGKVIQKKGKEFSRTNLDLSAQPNGIYILNIVGGKSISRWKIIKQ